MTNKIELCPRCGIVPLDRNQVRNALSRHIRGTYICSSCGTDEAMRDYTGEVLPIEKWANKEAGSSANDSDR